MAVWTLFPLLSLVVSLVSGSPAARNPVKARQAITTLSTSQIDAFEPYAWYADTGYCSASITINWSCGGVCLVFCFMLEIILFFQSIARQIQPSSHSHLAVMVTAYSFGLLVMIQHWRPLLSHTREPIPKKCMLYLMISPFLRTYISFFGHKVILCSRMAISSSNQLTPVCSLGLARVWKFTADLQVTRESALKCPIKRQVAHDHTLALLRLS